MISGDRCRDRARGSCAPLLDKGPVSALIGIASWICEQLSPNRRDDFPSATKWSSRLEDGEHGRSGKGEYVVRSCSDELTSRITTAPSEHPYLPQDRHRIHQRASPTRSKAVCW